MTIDEPEQTLLETPAIKNKIYNRQKNALVITGIFLSLMLHPYLAQLLLIYDLSYTQRIIASEMLEWLCAGIMFLYAWYAEGNNFFLWREKRYNVIFYLVSTILLFILRDIAGFISHIPFYLGYHENNDIARRMATVLISYPLLLVGSCLTAGIIEELIFRGYILSRLSLFFKNQHWPVIISALIFTSVHLAYKTIHELIFVFLIGLIFGYYYQRYRNLTVLIVVHFGIDLVVFSSYHLHK